MTAVDMKPDLFGVIANITRQPVVTTILLLRDILKPIQSLNLHLQRDHVSFSSLTGIVKNIVDELHLLISQYENSYDDTEFSKCRKIFKKKGQI